MKKIITYIPILLAAVCLMAACDDDDFYYRDQARVRIVGPKTWTDGSDSILFSFVAYPTDTVSKTFDVTIQLMGEAVDHDRTATFEVDASQTTAPAADYSFPTSVTMPAGATTATLPVTVKRTAALTSSSDRLTIRQTASSDFGVGVNEENYIKIIWNDVLSRPNNWSDLEEFFGTYSEVKYRFMLQHLEAGVTLSGDMSWAQLTNYKIKFQNALNEYNAAHPGAPLTDENGVLVTF